MDGKLKPWSQLGPYRYLAPLGRGGMADVCLVSVDVLGVKKLQVLKLLLDEYAEDPHVVAMFLDEARVAARLSHPNIVQTFEVAEHAGRYTIAMEYLEGHSLHRLMKRQHGQGQRVPEAVSLRLLCDVLDALQYAHRATDFDGAPLSIVHRDVSPGNIFVTYQGHGKLLDFGIAKAALQSAHTQAGMIKGKAGYMAPEQLRGGSVDRRADVFSTGVVMWELLTGRSYYDLLDAPSDPDATPPPVGTVNPAVPPALAAICDRALSYRKEDRFQSAEQMRQSIEEYVHAHGQPAGARLVSTWIEELAGPSKKFFDAFVSRALKTKHQAAPVVDELATGTTTDADFLPPEPTSFTVRPSKFQPSRGIKLPYVIGAMAFAVAVGVGVAGKLRPRETVPTAPTSVASEPEAAEATQAKARVSLEIRALPETATIYVDGAEVQGNPYVGSRVRDRRQHVIRIEAPGYLPREKHLRMDRDVFLRFSLTQDTGVE